MVAVADSLRTVDSLLSAQEVRNNAIVMALDSTDAEEAVEVAETPLADLLPPLRLQFHRSASGESYFSTDSAGVRFLANRMLRLSQAERRIAAVQRVADTRSTRITVLTRLAGTNAARADSAEARLATATNLAAECESLRQRQTKWLGFIPKPPRILVLAIGVGAGYLMAR